MLKPTGKGKISELSRKGKDSIRRKALLFNFDIDGDQLKDEHKKWLDDNIVPLLNNFGLNFTLRGLASRTGSPDYNKKLSERRLASVKNYLIGKGAKAAQFQGVGAGESDAEVAGEADGTEDEAFRGVIITVGNTTGKNKVEFTQVFSTDKENGFDETANPRWIMVRFEEPSREIRVINAAGFRIVSRQFLIATPGQFTSPRILDRITSDDEVIRVRGHLPGTTFFDIVDSDDEVLATLEVAVFEKLTLPTSFLYVKNPGVGTKRKPGQEVAFIAEANRIYKNQINVEIVALQAREEPVTGDFGTEINIADTMANGKNEWDELSSHRDKNARLTMFFAREVDLGPEDPNDDDANAITDVDGFVGAIEDESSPNVGGTLAHETGHALGVRHEKPIHSTQEMLMFSDPSRGFFIPRVHALLLRDGVKKK